MASTLLVGITVTGAEAASKQISFGKGKTGTSVSGKIKGNEDMDYLIHAGVGQTSDEKMVGSIGLQALKKRSLKSAKISTQRDVIC